MLTIRWRALWPTLLRAWPVGLALGAIIIVIIVFDLLEASLSDALRFTGTALQILGLTTVAKGLYDVRCSFGRPPLGKTLVGWAGALANVFRHPKPITAEMAESFSFTLSLEGRLKAGTGPDATTEVRLSALEKNLEAMQREMDEKFQSHQKRITEVQTNVNKESQERQAKDAEVSRLIEDIGVGGLRLEVVGLAWLFVGVIFTSIPGEVAWLLARVGIR